MNDTRRIAEAIEGTGDVDLLNRYLASLHDSLDAAWAEAEAALPEGWEEVSVTLERYPHRSAVVYVARAVGHFDDAAEMEGGPTPAAALRALTAKLREVAG